MSRYTVTAERSSKWWVLQAVEAPGAITQVSRLDQADTIREAIAFVTGEPEAEITITVVPVLAAVAQAHIERAYELRELAESSNREAAIETRAAARALKDAGLTLRDVGSIMDVSYQRAHQLVSS